MAKEGESKSCGGLRFRQDILVCILGLGFILALIAAIYGLGAWKHWDAPSGYQHNTTGSSAARFLPEPVAENEPYPQYHGRTNRPPGSLNGYWYYWKLKPDAVTAWSRVFVWLAYTAHQIVVWVILYMAQLARAHNAIPRRSTKLSTYNWVAFGVNIFFHLLHLLQTHVTYDGLAQDVLINSSQCSVIMLTVIIILLEYNERGLFVGWPTPGYHTGTVSQKLTLNLKPTYLARKYHGYAFSWAAIYTFWYHPMENTYGHVLGFFHTYIFLLQGSLFYTDWHWNRWWRLLLESWVLIHSTLVAFQTSNPAYLLQGLWPMFFFGFLFAFCFTQIYILPFWTRVPGWVRIFPPAIALAVIFGSYSVMPDLNGIYWIRMNEVIRIPAVYYVAVILVWAFMYLSIYVDGKIYGPSTSSQQQAQKQAVDPQAQEQRPSQSLPQSQPQQQQCTRAGVINIAISLFIFASFVAVAIVLEYVPLTVSFLVMGGVLVIFYTLGSGLVFVLAKHVVPWQGPGGTASGGLDQRNSMTSGTATVSSIGTHRVNNSTNQAVTVTLNKT